MQRSPQRRAWLVLFALLLGCSQVLEFDPSKIVADGGGGVGGSAGPAGGPGGPGGPGGVQLDGSLPDGDMPVVEAGPQCTQDTQCASNERCCMNECKKTSAALCTDCETGCNVTTADSCNDRACSCGNGPACAAGQFCVAGTAGGVSHCSECRDANDCAGRGDGKLQCVEGSCVQCDPATNAGCSGDTPICNASTRTCQACSSSPDNCPGNLVCTVSGACGGCANATADCTTPTAPICDADSTQCRACQGAVTNNPECMNQVSKPYCENDRCSVCRPSTEAGCDLASNRPDCRLNAEGQNECQACAADAHCENAGARRFCNTATGRCVACLSSAECTDSSRPFCDTTDGTCKPCNANPGGSDADHFWCFTETLVRPFCDSNSGRCVACLNASHCGGTVPVCDATSRMCRGCSQATEAADCPSPQAPACANNGRCVECRQGGTRTACDSGEQCSGNSCVDCVNDNGCSGTLPRCGPNNACVECVVASDCTGGSACTSAACMGNACSYTPMPVDDGIDCTVDSCSGGTIMHLPDNDRCSNADGFSCTVPTCTATGCVEMPNDGLCSTTDCFLNTCVGAGPGADGCSTEPIVCDAGLCVAGMCVL